MKTTLPMSTINHASRLLGGNRRRFSRRASIVAAGFALAALLPSCLLAAPAQDTTPCSADNAFKPVGEIQSKDGKLQAVIKVVGGDRKVVTEAGAPLTPSKLRYFEGYNVVDATQQWPGAWRCAAPGPTLRAKLGDVVQVTLLNKVNSGEFANTLDSGEQGRDNGCNRSTKGTSLYPGEDKYPNCFHGSSSANLHFHGTHVTPSTTGDNILIAVLPRLDAQEEEVGTWFQEVFQHCELGQEPKKWQDLPQGWRHFQEKLLREYDAKAVYTGPGRNPSGHGLPPALRLWPQNQRAIDHGIWPQWYIGSYPYCFQLPKYTVDQKGKSNVQMGQAPGTHWYHSHKHGSTALNMFNGLAGAFIIADDSPTGYDGKLRAFYQGQGKLDEKVMVLQQITTVLNLVSADPNPKAPPVLVNGQLVPTITMQPGEVQLWRLINATVSKTVKITFGGAAAKSGTIDFRRTAQDGVQLSWENFSNPAVQKQPIAMAPANRVDLLVQAPPEEGTFTIKSLVNIKVTGKPIPTLGFPTKSDDYPTFPLFLKDIEEARIHHQREIIYGSKASQPNPKGTQIQFMIDGKQFEDHALNQVMLLDTAEEWTVYNADTIRQIKHPFHIHVNPFQVFETFDPSTSAKPQPEPYIWWDTFAIPPPARLADVKTCPSKTISVDGVDWCLGYFRMRTRFVDFTGKYVQHCHILAHEDRGMMQLLEVVSNETVLAHH
jgi:FtsP/CotA-like multicopper oxidase with cupredoxin domain